MNILIYIQPPDVNLLRGCTAAVLEFSQIARPGRTQYSLFRRRKCIAVSSLRPSVPRVTPSTYQAGILGGQ